MTADASSGKLYLGWLDKRRELGMAVRRTSEYVRQYLSEDTRTLGGRVAAYLMAENDRTLSDDYAYTIRDSALMALDERWLRERIT